MALSAGTRLGPYEIVAPVGAGGMGEVYRARDTRLGRDVAIKILPSSFTKDAEMLRRFEQEARAAGGLNHPNILAIFDIGAEDGSPYVVAEMLEGEPLRSRLGEGPLAPRKAVDYALQIARGLAAAHEKGIVHRDLKPENVFVTRDERVKILDFGLAKLAPPLPLATEATGTLDFQATGTSPGTVLGTVGYMSPEQVRALPTDHRSDIFSFGAVLYEMLAGQRAFRGDSAIEVLNAILKDDPGDVSPRRISPGLEQIVRRCMEKRPDQRFQSAADVAFSLEAVSGHTGVHAAASLGHRRRWPWMALALGLLLAGLAASALLSRTTEVTGRPVRFFVLPTEGTTVAGAIAVSPDGKQLAYATTARDGRRSLWVRPLESLHARALPGTEDAIHPFWSPDSRFLGFFAEGKLKKIRVEGAPPQTLCEVFDARGGTWSRDGVIVFAPNVGDRLYRIADTGGVPVPVTTLESSRQETSHQWPRLLPDGRHFLYVVWSAQAESRGVHVGSLDGMKPRRLLGTDWGAVYAPGSDETGHLMFLRGRTLMAQAFDPRGFALSGEPIPVADEVWYDETVPGLASFSVSENGVLTYRSGAIRSTQLGWYDRAGKLLGTAGLPGAHRDPFLSPDETRFVASRMDAETGTLDLWLFELSRGVSSRLTSHPGNDATPLWAPDGTRIVFASEREGPANLYEKVWNGAGNETVLLKSPVSKYPTGWAPDGQSIIYASWDDKTKWDLWIRPDAGGQPAFPYLQTDFDSFQARFSPDGKWIAYSSNESNRYEVYVQPFPMASGKWQVSTDGGAQPLWRGDGKELFYLAPDRRLMAVGVKAGATFDPQPPKALFQAQVTGLVDARNHYAVSGDGQRFLVSALVGESSVSPIAVAVDWATRLEK